MKKEQNNCGKVEGIETIFLKETGSTMDQASIFVNNNMEGLVVAEKQQRGRGRYGKSWDSPSGGLYFSWAVKNKAKMKSYLSEAVSLSLVETLESFGIRTCKIKFPNDIIVNGNKIAGILIEKKGDFYIIGIGINVNNNCAGIKNAISMKEIKKKEFETGEILKNFIKKCKINLNKFSEDINNMQIWSEYLLK
jgi:BirA family transcriptional regulator, biotin operon repressor / biotin---[acetyl-CoA-carboxylase] ligase